MTGRIVVEEAKMVALWAPDEDVRQQVLDVMDLEERILVAATWGEFRGALSDASCGIVAEPDPRPELFGHLQSLRSRGLDGTMVLALRRNPRVLRRLKDVIVEEVVWMDELSDLPAAVRGARTERRLQQMEREVRRAEHLPETLVEAVVRALRSRPPLTSVQELAGELERDRRTLWHHWRSAVDEEESELTLKGFLDWIVLLRAAAMKTESRSWHDVADELGVHARTLRRVVQRRTGSSLRDLPTSAGREGQDFLDAFREEAMAPLLRTGPRAGPQPPDGRSG